MPQVSRSTLVRTAAAVAASAAALTILLVTRTGASDPGSVSFVITAKNATEDAVIWCRAASWTGVYLDSAKTQPIDRSDFVCPASIPTKTTYWLGTCNNPTTVAFPFVLGRNDTITLFGDPETLQLTGLTCWYQSLAGATEKGNDVGQLTNVNQIEMTLLSLVSGDQSFIPGFSAGALWSYELPAGQTGNEIHTFCSPQGPPGNASKYAVVKHGFDVYYVPSEATIPGPDLNQCQSICPRFDPTIPACLSAACMAPCSSVIPGPTGTCAIHHCRQFWDKQYRDPTSYAYWLATTNKCAGYLWPLGEIKCVDASCGYGGPGQPADCAAVEAAGFGDGAKYGQYSCGVNPEPSGSGPTWWATPEARGCVTNTVEGTDVQPNTGTKWVAGSTMTISLWNLPWIKAAYTPPAAASGTA